MTDDRVGANVRESAVRAWLRGAVDPVVIALRPTCVRVPLPDEDCFSGVATLAGSGQTFADVVVAADRIAVALTWDRAQVTGMAEGAVRSLSHPERAQRLMFVDTTEAFGVWIGLLVEAGRWQSAGHCGGQNAGLSAGPRGGQNAAPGAGQRGGQSVAPSAEPVAQTVARGSRTGSLGKNLSAVITEIDANLTAVLGWSADELVGRRSLEFVHPEDHPVAVAQWLEVRSGRPTERVRLRHRHRDGHWLWVEIENVPVGVEVAGFPQATVVRTLIDDVSDEVAVQQRVQQQERLFDRVAESLPIGLLLVADDRSVVFANARVSEVLGSHPHATLDQLLARVDPHDRMRVNDALTEILHGRGDHEVEVALVPVGGEVRRCLFTLAALTEADGLRGASVAVSDSTASSRLREDLDVRASIDPLTGCHSRVSGRLALEQALRGRGAEHTAAFFVDLNQFRAINVSFGHPSGDRFLIEVSRRLAQALRTGDTLARWGGDEFLIVCPRVGSQPAAAAVLTRLSTALATPIRMDRYDLGISASIGYALASPGVTVDDLIAQASTAMFNAKRGIPEPASVQ